MTMALGSAAHADVGEVDGDAVAGLGDAGFDDAADAGDFECGIEDALVLAVGVAPVGGAGFAAEGPVEEIFAAVGDVDGGCGG
jgi:hypothetical protein